jgi:Protein of unknown function (DUF2510)
MDAAQSPAQYQAGWHSFAGGLRFHDGTDWTDHLAPPPPKRQPLNRLEVALAVAVGVLLALAIVWGLAQIAPEQVYIPVKFVVELPGLNL